MSASIEALAMAGVDYLIHNLDIEEWEQEELELPPPHLLADEEEEEEVERKSKDSFPPPAMKKILLSIDKCCNCEGCRKKVDRILSETKGMEGNATRSWNADNLLTVTMTGTIDIQALTDRFWKRMHKKNVDVKILALKDEDEKKVGSKSSSKEKPIEKSDPASSEKDDSTKSSPEEKTSENEKSNEEALTACCWVILKLQKRCELPGRWSQPSK
ncbi:hypothetical protein D5086_017945 [Populus alba]|uniref:Uncharacterized protein n=1 Tax=Populus alba TaxID=43335 RepID=A0ACC4BP41_POPAL